MAERTLAGNEKREIKKQVQTTKGDIEGFDRGVWKYMKNQFNLSDVEILKMKMARCPARINGKVSNVFRLFDPEIAREKGITINDFEALTSYPDLVLYEGYRIHGKDGETVIQKNSEVKSSLLDEKLKNGELSELGVVIEKTAGQKWLGRIGKFMMMGGFMLVIILGVIIAVLMSVLFKC